MSGNTSFSGITQASTLTASALGMTLTPGDANGAYLDYGPNSGLFYFQNGSLIGGNFRLRVNEGSMAIIEAYGNYPLTPDLNFSAAFNGLFDSVDDGMFGYSSTAGSWQLLPSITPCAAAIAGAVAKPTLGGGGTSIKASFRPGGGIAAAETACGVAGFDWVQTVTIPAPSRFEACTDVSCSSLTLQNVTGVTSDPPEFGWSYCNPNSLTYDPTKFGNCLNNYPFYYPNPVNAIDVPPQVYCIEYASNNPGAPCVATFQNDDAAINFFDTPSDQCLPPGGYYLLGLPYCVDPPGSAEQFTTQLVGVSAGGEEIPLSTLGLAPGVDSFTWSDTFNGTTGGISGSDLPADPGSGTGGITILSVDGVPVPEPGSLAMMSTALVALLLVEVGRRFNG